MAIAATKQRLFITVDRDTLQRVRLALDELGVGRASLSRMLNETLAGHLVILEKLCAPKRKKSRQGPASFTSLLLEWGQALPGPERSSGRNGASASGAAPRNGRRSA